ncbi:MAG TPA: hypothetical protein VKT81_06135 [Bryobacteraceae bacterium]|nr:hypothetical protein [Bryobacteraceae bacterium]
MRLGRIVFGLSAILFGILALMWYDPDTWQTLSQIWKLPSGKAIGGFLMIVQIAGGIGILFQKTVRWGSVLLIVVYALFSLACIPGILAAPAVYVHYGSFFEQFCLLSGAIGLFAPWSRLSRLGIGASAVSFTLSQIFYFSLTAQLVPKWIPPSQSFWTVVTTIAFGLAALAILANFRARLALGLMTFMLVSFGVLIWVPSVVAHPEVHGNCSELDLTFLIAGAVWVQWDLAASKVTPRQA